MNPRSEHIHIHAGLLALGALWVSGACAVELVKGRVVDLGLPEPVNGIAGVSVVVADVATQKPVGQGVTDVTGAYQIEVNRLRSAKLVATFTKLGYFARPTVQTVASLALDQPSVKLSKENAPEAYYKATADNIRMTYVKDPAATSTLFSAVASLPSSEKQTVFDALKFADADAYGKLQAADKTYQATQDFLSKYKGSGDPDSKAVGAYANFGATGTVWLYGSVPSAGSKKDFEKAIKAFTGVKNVQNDLMISK